MGDAVDQETLILYIGCGSAGAVVLGIVIGVIIWCCRRRRERNAVNRADDPEIQLDQIFEAAEGPSSQNETHGRLGNGSVSHAAQEPADLCSVIVVNPSVNRDAETCSVKDNSLGQHTNDISAGPYSGRINYGYQVDGDQEKNIHASSGLTHKSDNTLEDQLTAAVFCKSTGLAHKYANRPISSSECTSPRYGDSGKISASDENYGDNDDGNDEDDKYDDNDDERNSGDNTGGVKRIHISGGYKISNKGAVTDKGYTKSPRHLDQTFFKQSDNTTQRSCTLPEGRGGRQRRIVRPPVTVHKVYRYTVHDKFLEKHVALTEEMPKKNRRAFADKKAKKNYKRQNWPKVFTIIEVDDKNVFCGAIKDEAERKASGARRPFTTDKDFYVVNFKLVSGDRYNYDRQGNARLQLSCEPWNVIYHLHGVIF